MIEATGVGLLAKVFLVNGLLPKSISCPDLSPLLRTCGLMLRLAQQGGKSHDFNISPFALSLSKLNSSLYSLSIGNRYLTMLYRSSAL